MIWYYKEGVQLRRMERASRIPLSVFVTRRRKVSMLCRLKLFSDALAM